MSDSTTTMNVSADVMAQFEAVKGGASRAQVAKDRGITASTVGANVKRVQAALDAGRTLTVEGEAKATDAGPAQVDPHEVAEAMTEGASIVTRNLSTVEAEAQAIHAKATTLRAQADTRDAEADALIVKAMPRINAVATALGFDLDAWRAQVTEAKAKAKAEADNAPAPEADNAPAPQAQA